MSAPEAWLWFDLTGHEQALEELLARLEGHVGAEHWTRDGRPGLRLYWPLSAAGVSRSRVREAARSAGARLVDSGRLERQDWLARWREGLEPVKASRRFRVGPPGTRARAGEDVILIDQRRAFGTGHHATTQLCLRLLERAIRPGDSVMDVGTGSAVLAIAAARLGAARVFAFDNDPEVLEEARRNLRLNRVASRVELATGELAQFPRRRTTHVVANLILERLRPIMGDLARRVTSGVVIVSGAETSEREELRQSMRGAGMRVERMSSSRGWLAAAGRPGSGSGGSPRRAWLVKEEPENYPFTQLVEEGRAEWEGVRNHVAKKHLAAMKRGDLVLYYHTGRQKAVVGLARVAREAYPDPGADDPRWLAVDLVPLRSLERPVTLATIRQDPVFEEMPLVRQPRLSVMPVAERELARMLELAGTALEAGE